MHYLEAAGQDKRRSSRIACKVGAKTSASHASYKGLIENFSREGLLKTLYNVRELEIIPGDIVVVSFSDPTGKRLELECEVRWKRETPHDYFGLKHHIGLEILEPPEAYLFFIQNLYYATYKTMFSDYRIFGQSHVLSV